MSEASVFIVVGLGCWACAAWAPVGEDRLFLANFLAGLVLIPFGIVSLPAGESDLTVRRQHALATIAAAQDELAVQALETQAATVAAPKRGGGR